MELIIDAVRCDLPEGKIQLPKLDLSRLGDVAAHRTGRELQLQLPPTVTNDRLFEFGRDPESIAAFNRKEHAACLMADGACCMRGSVVLLEASEAGYTIRLREGGTAWAAQAAQRMLHELQIDYTASLTPQTILESWTDSSPVKFFPVHRDAYDQQMSGTDLLPAERLLTVDDYHPFLHLATLIEQLFREAGYSLESRFFASEFFRKLYMSGAYSSRDTTAAMNRMGFLARRLHTVTAEADYMGRVYADPAALAHTVGNLVESASPLAVDETGEVLQELYAFGHCFTQEEGRILFRPLSEVSVGFEYYLKYVTQHRIESRTTLKGFDTLYLPGCGMIRSTLTNRYEDRRKALSNGHSYRVVVFDHEAGDSYRILLTQNGVSNVLWANFSGRSALVTSPASGTLSTPVLQRKTTSGWENCASDWALYDGYIEEMGTTTVELRLHAPAEVLTPEQPKYFDTIFFGGAEEGMTLTLDRTCSIRPLFGATPGYGSTLDFAAVSQHAVRQIELLEAVAHLFNLRFVTDEERRTVRVEPSDVLYRTSPVIDWRDKVLLDAPITLQDQTHTLHERMTWCYGVAEGAAARYERAEDTHFGAWSYAIESVAALQGEQVKRNPLFHPSVSSVGHYRNAPSAHLLQVGDRDAATYDGTNFSPRLVSYRGMTSLPEGELWGYPSHEASYPLVAFHLPATATDRGFTLCFEDRDGVKGLHSYYDNDLRCASDGGVVELTLWLSPAEIESLLRPEGEGATLRSIFRLRNACGEFRGILRSIERGPYDRGGVRCTFTRIDR
ncbi:MAG: hypothetical protein E7132_00530 [Rikenellaceae bacterium]|nr:hypothetical protein [Rikenellaceae bacterium]